MNLTRRLLLELVPTFILSWFGKPKENINQLLADAPKIETKETPAATLYQYVANEILRQHGPGPGLSLWVTELFTGVKLGRYDLAEATKEILTRMLAGVGVKPINAPIPGGMRPGSRIASPRYVKDVDYLKDYHGLYAQMLWDIVEPTRIEVLKSPYAVFSVCVNAEQHAYMLEAYVIVHLIESRPNTYGPIRFTPESPNGELRTS